MYGTVSRVGFQNNNLSGGTNTYFIGWHLVMLKQAKQRDSV